MPVPRILGLDAVEPGSLQPFYTSDFIDGVALDTFARASTWQQVETAEADAIEALGLLHQAGVRHGDIKPDNILVHAGRGTLIDLGCARPLGAMPDGTISGTGAFMAPELLEATSADGRADLFSLGKTLAQVAADHTGKVPPPILALIERLTRPRVVDRPVDVNEVLEHLGRQRAACHPVVRCLGRLGGRQGQLSEWERAAEAIADRAGLLSLHLAAARLQRDAGHAAEALRRLERCEVDAAERHGRSALRHEMGACLLGLGDRKRARTCSTNRPSETVDEAQRMADEAAALGMRAEEAMAHDLLADAWIAQSSTALSRSHRLRARELWERMAVELPPVQRAAFWRHPRRATALPPQEASPANDLTLFESLGFVAPAALELIANRARRAARRAGAAESCRT